MGHGMRPRESERMAFGRQMTPDPNSTEGQSEIGTAWGTRLSAGKSAGLLDSTQGLVNMEELPL